jgi:D-glucuronyl C5-epimerase C-terminus
MALFPASAAADPVVVLGPSGHATVRNDPFLTVPAITPAPSPSPPARPVRTVAPAPRATAAGARKAPRRKPKKTVTSELARLYGAGDITQAQDNGYKAAWNSALGTERRLHGTRRAQLAGVTANLQQMAGGGCFTPSRLPVLFLTLARNQQYWRTGPLLSYGQRVEFSGSRLVWEYYPGQGIELTVLGSFGVADGLYTAGRSQYRAFQKLLGELIPLAAMRGGSLTWEYYFKFDGGTPPWTSAMSQGTAIEALTRGYEALQKDSKLQYVDYLSIAHQALAIFTRRPKVGVGMPTALGKRFVQYSFAPGRGVEVINAFLQSLIGLYDYAQASDDPTAASLFASGNAEAESEVPHFDTGAWSLYQPGEEDDLSYHELVTGFLAQLCSQTGAPVYCTTAQHFQTYLKTPPALTLLTTHARARKRITLSFRLSKISHVGVVILRGTQTVFSTSASFPYGVHSFAVPAIKRTGQYTIHLAGTDLAGNFNRIVGSVQITR